jgi:hypothetical protein
LIVKENKCVKETISVSSTCVSHLVAYDGTIPCCDGLTPYLDYHDKQYSNTVCINPNQVKPYIPGQCVKNMQTFSTQALPNVEFGSCCSGLIDYINKSEYESKQSGGSIEHLCLDKAHLSTQDKPFVSTDNEPVITTTAEGWKDYSSMLEMPKVTVDSGMPVCTTVPDEKFHGCYYKGKIDDQINIPDQSLILGGETVVGNRIDHDWGTEKIISGLDGASYTDNVSAIWKGKFYFGEGDYLFKATADDGVKVILDDNSNVIYKWYPQPRNTHISDLTHLTEGYHTVTVRYYEEGHKAAVKVWWEEQRPAIEAEALSAELSTFQKLIEQLRDLVTKVLNFFGIE